jgi:hypothetical protein
VFGGVGGDGLTKARSFFIRSSMTDSKNTIKHASLYVYAIDASDNKRHRLNLTEIPLIGDTIIILNEGVFKVVERGQIADTKKLACGWIRIEKIEGRNVAPGSDYHFMESWDKQ